MENSKEVSVCRISESSVSVNEKVGSETLEDSVKCGSDSHVEGLSGEDAVGGGSERDIMVEVLGSDVYIDGVCTNANEAELREQVACGGSFDGCSDVKPSVVDEAEAVFEARSENPAAQLDGEVLKREEGSREALKDGGVANMEGAPALDNGDGKEEDGVRSFNGGNVHSESVGKDGEQLRDLGDEGVREGGSDVTLKPCDRRKEIANGEGDEILKKEACVGGKDGNTKIGAGDEQLQSTIEQPMDIDNVGGESISVPKVVSGVEVAVDKGSSNSGEKCVRVENCGDKELISDTSHVSSDTGQGMEIDKHSYTESLPLLGGGQNSETHETAASTTNRDVGEICSIKTDGGVTGHVLSESSEQVNLEGNVSDVKPVSSHKGKEEDAEGQSALTNEGSGNASIQGTAEEKSNDEVPLSADDLKLISLKHVNQNLTSNDQVGLNVRETNEAQLNVSCEQADSDEREEMECKEYNSDDPHYSTDEKTTKHMAMKPGSSGEFYQANYILPPEKEGDFSVSDMVWGKVRSHPWWPGQIFDPSDASEKAMKHHKKDCFLVAYFGDRTFAWNEASQLKPFRAHFSNIEKQSNSETFHNAVDCAIDEVSRRVEFGLACSCIPKDIYDDIKFQTVENAGIHEEARLSYGLDESLNAKSFSPDKLLDYLANLSRCPTGGFDRLDLGIVKAQLLAFYRLKGYTCLPEIQYCGGLDCDMDSSTQDVENNVNEGIQHETPSKDADQASSGHRVSKGHNNSYHKRKHNLKDGKYPKKKEKSLSELFGGTFDSPDDFWSDEKDSDSLVSPTVYKRRKTVDPYADDSGMQDGKKTISLAKVSSSAKPSFKIGECIRRVASQLTGSPTVKGSDERSQKPEEITELSVDISEDVAVQNLEEAKKSSPSDPTEYSSLNDLLSLLQWAAQDPRKHCNFISVIVSFFSDFRNSIVVGNYSEREITPTNKVGAKRKKQSIAGAPETFEFEDMSDNYWTDRVIQNGSEEQPSKRSRKKENQLALTDPEKPVQVTRRPYSRKRFSDNSNVSNVETSEKPSGYIDDKSPAELVMNFAELDSVPSETNLNKMFRRFGPLKESETEVDTMGSRARVVFKKCADAEVAFNSAKKFNIFGAILVNYQLNYTPSALFKASTVVTTHDQEMHLDLSNFDVNMV